MNYSTVKIRQSVIKKIWQKELETILNSEFFEDFILWYQMAKWETWERESYDLFKQKLWY